MGKPSSCGGGGGARGGAGGSGSGKSSSSGGGRGPCGQKVEVSRSVGASGGIKDGQSHSGMVVKTEGGGKYLVHKGDGYGHQSHTVATNAVKMREGNWTSGVVKQVSGKHTVSDYVTAGGKEYNSSSDNSHHATRRMGQLD